MRGKSGPAMAATLPSKTAGLDPNDPPAMQLTLPGTADAVRRTLREIMTTDLLLGLSVNLRASAEIVLAEVLNNIVEHAYAAHAGDIEILLSACETGLCCTVVDRGAAMPGLFLPKGDLQSLGPTPDLPEGGFGWFLIRSLVTELHYHRAGGENRLRFLLCDEQS